MATKRIAKRGRMSAGSSSQGRPEVRSKHAHDRQPTLPAKFRSPRHKTFHDNQTKRRSIIPERPLATTNSVFDSLPLPPLARGWGRFASHPSAACKNILREFYANGRDLPGTDNLPKGESYVRGCRVRFDKHTINALLEIPPPAEEEICYYDQMVKGNFDPDEVIRVLCVQGARWTQKVNGTIKGLYRKDLKPLPMEFLNFILASIHPSKHCYEVTMERVFILYNMMTGRYMDLGRILADELAKTVESNRAITCPSLVYKLCVHAGVPDEIEDEITPGPILGVKLIQRRHTAFDEMPPQQLSDESDRAYRERCTVANETPPPTAGEARILAALERNERALERNERRTSKLIKFAKFLYKEIRSLKKHFRKRNRSPSPSNPPDLSSSSQQEEEEASEDEEDEEQAAAAGNQDSSAEESEHDIEEDSDE